MTYYYNAFLLSLYIIHMILHGHVKDGRSPGQGVNREEDVN
jgi:hypothetical protein